MFILPYNSPINHAFFVRDLSITSSCMNALSARSTLAIIFASALTAFFALTATANGLTTYTVTDKSDTLGASGNYCAADGSGDAGEGNCTLRVATYFAGIDGDDSKILLEAGTYSLTSVYDSTMTQDIAWGDLEIENDGSLIIEGAGRAQTTIDASVVSDRIFDIVPGAEVTIKKMELTGGFLTVDDGGAIKNSGDLVLQNMSLTGNQALHGGAIQMNGSTATTTVTSTLIDNNTALSTGGGIAVRGGTGSVLEVRNATVENNSAASGGAISVEDGEATVIKSLVYNNAASTSAGAIYVSGTAADLEIQNSTIGENTTAGSGGGLYLNTIGSSNTVDVISSTIYGNVAGTDGTGDGGAVRAYDSGIDFEQSIIAGNVANGGTDQNCSLAGTAVITSSDYNIESGNDCGLTGTNDITSTDPQLLTIADNGGLTETYAFDLSGGYSTLAAVDAIPAANCAYTTDQRSAVRPDAGGANCDIGAYEVQDADRDSEESLSYGGADECEESFGIITATEYYLDNDHDGAYDQSTVHEFCEGPTSDYVLVTDVTGDTDCDDTNAGMYPGNTETPYDGVDNDCDAGTVDDDLDADGQTSTVTGGLDCVDDGTQTTDEGNVIVASEIYDGATEIWYDGIDQNCDGANDYDQDADGYESEMEFTGGADCEDQAVQTTRTGALITAAEINPAATDVWYDNVDQNCDGLSDHDKDLDGEDRSGWDFDGDGVADGGTDCVDDGTATRTDGNLVPATSINTAAAEDWYDGVDQNCDARSDYDQDGDSFDSDAFGGTDCLDTDQAVFVGATDTWYDGVDSDCAGNNDYDQDTDGFESAAETAAGTDCDDLDATLAYALYTDEDADGLGETDGYQCSATATLSGYVDNDDDVYPKDVDNDGYNLHEDCDDTDGDVNPGQGEVIYDGVDNDCNATTRDNDLDQDGFGQADDANDTNATIYPGAAEIADGVDNDGDGRIDEDTDVSDDDSDGLSESDGDCDDTDATVGKTTTGFIDADGDGNGAGDAIILCVAELPRGFSTNDTDDDDTDDGTRDPINPRVLNVALLGAFRSAAEAGNGDVTMTYAEGSIDVDVFDHIQATTIRYAPRYDVVFVVSGDGRKLAMIDTETATVQQIVNLPKRKNARGNNRIWVKSVNKGKAGAKKPTILIVSDNRLVSVIYKKNTREFGKKSAMTVEGIRFKKPTGKKNKLNVKSTNGPVKLKMTKKGKLTRR